LQADASKAPASNKRTRNDARARPAKQAPAPGARRSTRRTPASAAATSPRKGTKAAPVAAAFPGAGPSDAAAAAQPAPAALAAHAAASPLSSGPQEAAPALEPQAQAQTKQAAPLPSQQQQQQQQPADTPCIESAAVLMDPVTSATMQALVRTLDAPPDPAAPPVDVDGAVSSDGVGGLLLLGLQGMPALRIPENAGACGGCTCWQCAFGAHHAPVRDAGHGNVCGGGGCVGACLW
jgi:hypothetical protein